MVMKWFGRGVEGTGFTVLEILEVQLHGRKSSSFVQRAARDTERERERGRGHCHKIKKGFPSARSIAIVMRAFITLLPQSPSLSSITADEVRQKYETRHH